MIGKQVLAISCMAVSATALKAESSSVDIVAPPIERQQKIKELEEQNSQMGRTMEKERDLSFKKVGKPKQLKTCTKCNAQWPTNFSYCAECGAELPTGNGWCGPVETQEDGFITGLCKRWDRWDPFRCKVMDPVISEMIDKNLNGDIDGKDAAMGWSALHYATHNSDPTIIDPLIQHYGLDPNERDNSGSTAMHWAAFNGEEDIIKKLLENGADVDPVNNNMQTPLFRAAEVGKTNVIDILVVNGAVPTHEILKRAQDNKFLDFVEVLSQHMGADVAAGVKMQSSQSSESDDEDVAIWNPTPGQRMKKVKEPKKTDKKKKLNRTGVDMEVGEDGQQRCIISGVTGLPANRQLGINLVPGYQLRIESVEPGTWAAQYTRLNDYLGWDIITVNQTNIRNRDEFVRAMMEIQVGQDLAFTLVKPQDILKVGETGKRMAHIDRTSTNKNAMTPDRTPTASPPPGKMVASSSAPNANETEV